MSAELQSHPYAKTIWDLLFTYIQNEYGVAALMGNLKAESGLYPDRVQGDVPYSSYSKEYTANVDSGAISENDFVNNGPNGGGYGLAQWTFYTRKQALYDMWKIGGYDSIGSVDLACAYLIHELETSYAGVLKKLKTATDIRTPSDSVLHDFESPADQSTAVEEMRAAMGTEIYETFTGTSAGGGGGSNKPKRKGMSKLLLYAVATDEF